MKLLPQHYHLLLYSGQIPVNVVGNPNQELASIQLSLLHKSRAMAYFHVLKVHIYQGRVTATVTVTFLHGRNTATVSLIELCLAAEASHGLELILSTVNYCRGNCC